MRLPASTLSCGLLLLGLLLLMLAPVFPRPAATPTAPDAVPTPATSARLVAHGVVSPTSQARVGTLSGGVLLGVSVAIGEQVEPHRELARVPGPADPDVTTAPFSRPFTSLRAHV